MSLLPECKTISEKVSRGAGDFERQLDLPISRPTRNLRVKNNICDRYECDTLFYEGFPIGLPYSKLPLVLTARLL